MYPRNAAAPPEVDLGQILQLSDGAIQTTGASVRVKIGTSAWGAGAGTLACDTTSGIWTYLPTQEETDAAYFIIAVYKASCTALSKTVVTSISATAGYAGLDWANILSPTTTVNLSGTTIKTATDVETDTQNIQTRLPAALVSGRIDTSVGAYQSGLAPPTATENKNAVWNAATLDHTSTGSFGHVIGLLFGLIENVTGWRFTSKALEQAPSGSGDSVIVAPLVQTSSQRAQPSYIQTNQYDKSTLGPFRIEQANGDQYDLSDFTDWIVVVWDKDDNQLGVVAYADIDFSSSTSNAVMDQYSFAPVAGQVAIEGRHRFALRRPQGTSEQTAASGVFNVVATPRGPAA